jgi:hypothetical protein
MCRGIRLVQVVADSRFQQLDFSDSCFSRWGQEFIAVYNKRRIAFDAFMYVLQLVPDEASLPSFAQFVMISKQISEGN